jgi:LPS biosynthesis glycosyltransferase-like protein
MKTKIRIKYVDINMAANVEAESSMQCGGNDLIFEALSKNYEVEFSDDPEIIFSWYPVGGLKGTDYFKYNCKRCLWLLESEFPDFNCFDYVMSPYHNLKYYDRHLYIPASIISGNNFQTELNYKIAQEKHKVITSDLVNRKFCSFTVSNDTDADRERVDFFKKLSEYKTVDSGGMIYNNIGGRIKNKLEFDSAHKFSIAFENMKGSFITEKLDAAFAGKTVPIYWGNPYVTEVYNSKAFINCHDYDSFEDVVKRVIELDNNDEEYLSMLREPAFVINKPINDVKAELAEFLSKIVDDDRGGVRSVNCTNRRAERVKYLGREVFWKREKRKERIMKILVFLFKPWTHSKLGKYVKRLIVNR